MGKVFIQVFSSLRNRDSCDLGHINGVHVVGIFQLVVLHACSGRTPDGEMRAVFFEVGNSFWGIFVFASLVIFVAAATNTLCKGMKLRRQEPVP